MIRILLFVLTLVVTCPIKAQQQKPTGIRTFEDLPQDKCTKAEVDTSNMPKNRDQANLGWCHAYVLADLMSFYTKKQVSAYGIAANVYKVTTDHMKTYEGLITEMGKNPGEDYRYISKTDGRLCLESNFTPTNNDWGHLSQALWRVDYERFQKEDRECLASYFEVTKGLDEDVLKVVDKLSGSAFVSAVISAKCKESIPLPQGKVMKYGLNMEYKCDSKDLDPSFHCWATPTGSDDLPVEKLDQRLSLGEPVGISYDERLLLSRPGYLNTQRDHVSTIIGRRFNEETQQCEYQLRNSWGADCTKYAVKYQKGCNNGTLWIPRVDLLMSAEQISEFIPSP